MRLSLSSCFVTALAVQQAVSIPFDERSASASNCDNNIAEFALTLEHLEVAFYTRGLQQFSESAFMDAGYKPIIRRRFEEIFEHEQDHVALLTKALGKQAPQACNYSFPITDLRSFIDLSQVFEEVGTSAYTGAIQFLKSQENILVSASILATEANQAAWLATFNGDVPWGGSFKTALTMRQAFSLASAFITWCPPSNPKLNLTPFPPLNIDGAFPKNRTATPGQKVNVKPSSSKSTHIAFLTGREPIFVPIQSGTVVFPENVSGQVYAISTSSGSDWSDSSTQDGPAILLFEKFSNGTLTN